MKKSRKELKKEYAETITDPQTGRSASCRTRLRRGFFAPFGRSFLHIRAQELQGAFCAC